MSDSYLQDVSDDTVNRWAIRMRNGTTIDRIPELLAVLETEIVRRSRMAPVPRFLPYQKISKELGIPTAWLVDRANRGELPAVTVGKKLFGCPNTIRMILARLASADGVSIVLPREVPHD